MLSKLIYISKDSVNFQEQDIQALTEQSVIRNDKFHLTGFLTLHKGMFIQYLEGNTSNLDYIWSSIQNDERHIIKKSLRYESTGKHIFPDWRMNYISPNAMTDIIFGLVDTIKEPVNDEIVMSIESIIQEVYYA